MELPPLYKYGSIIAFYIYMIYVFIVMHFIIFNIMKCIQLFLLFLVSVW